MKLLLVGTASVHMVNFYNLVKPLFSEICMVTDQELNVDCSCEIVSFSFKPINYLKRLAHQKSILKLAQKFNPDVVHIHQANTTAKLVFNALKTISVSKVLTTWGSDVLLIPNQSWILKRMVVQNLLSADLITADAITMKLAVESLTNNKKTAQLITFGVDDKLLLDQRPKQNILFSNRAHQPLYRVDVLLNGFIEFLNSNQHTNWQLIIANEGSETQKLKKLAEPYKNNIQFVGFLSSNEQMDYYAKAKCYISIPKSDGTAVSLLEAMASGCYPIVSNLAANKQWINNGDNGTIADLSNLPEQLSSIFQLAENELQVVVKQNKNIIEKHATRTVVREKFKLIYQSLQKHG